MAPVRQHIKLLMEGLKFTIIHFYDHFFDKIENKINIVNVNQLAAVENIYFISKRKRIRGKLGKCFMWTL